jgi:hypothetical protein
MAHMVPMVPMVHMVHMARTGRMAHTGPMGQGARMPWAPGPGAGSSA